MPMLQNFTSYRIVVQYAPPTSCIALDLSYLAMVWHLSMLSNALLPSFVAGPSHYFQELPL